MMRIRHTQNVLWFSIKLFIPSKYFLNADAFQPKAKIKIITVNATIMVVDLLEFFQKVTLTTTLQTNNVWQCLLQKILSLWWMKSRWARIYFTHILFTVPSRYVIRIQPYLVFKFRHLKETPTGFEQTYI